jgi:hypothetical protein
MAELPKAHHLEATEIPVVREYAAFAEDLREGPPPALEPADLLASRKTSPRTGGPPGPPHIRLCRGLDAPDDPDGAGQKPRIRQPRGEYVRKDDMCDSQNACLR